MPRVDIFARRFCYSTLGNEIQLGLALPTVKGSHADGIHQVDR